METKTVVASLIINDICIEVTVQIPIHNFTLTSSSNIKSIDPLIFEYKDDISIPILDIDNVYIVKAIGTNSYKIGCSVHPYQRLREISTCCPLPVILIACCPGSYKRETFYHKKYKSMKIRHKVGHENVGKEWFEFDESIVSLLKDFSLLRILEQKFLQDLKIEITDKSIPSLKIPSPLYIPPIKLKSLLLTIPLLVECGTIGESNVLINGIKLNKQQYMLYNKNIYQLDKTKMQIEYSYQLDKDEIYFAQLKAVSGIEFLRYIAIKKICQKLSIPYQTCLRNTMDRETLIYSQYIEFNLEWFCKMHSDPYLHESLISYVDLFNLQSDPIKDCVGVTTMINSIFTAWSRTKLKRQQRWMYKGTEYKTYKLVEAAEGFDDLFNLLDPTKKYGIADTVTLEQPLSLNNNSSIEPEIEISSHENKYSDDILTEVKCSQCQKVFENNKKDICTCSSPHCQEKFLETITQYVSTINLQRHQQLYEWVNSMNPSKEDIKILASIYKQKEEESK